MSEHPGFNSDQLLKEFEFLDAQSFASLIPLLVRLHRYLDEQMAEEDSLHKLQELVDESREHCKAGAEWPRLQALNRFFFQTKGFAIQEPPPKASHHHLDFLFTELISRKGGMTLPLSLLYLYLAQALELPLKPTRLIHQGVLKWAPEGRSSYVDLKREGQLLSEPELLSILRSNHLARNEKTEDVGSLCEFRVLPAKLLALIYLKMMAKFCEQGHRDHTLFRIYQLILTLEPTSLHYLEKRALLGRDLGEQEQALQDIKRYFSFSDRNKAPHSLKVAYYELQSWQQVDQSR